MITHVLVELKQPVKEEYFRMDTVLPSEYYGYGTPVIMCKDCKYAYRGYKKYVCTRQFNDFSIWPDGYCSLAEREEE